jgi:hypothetical protein
MGYLRLHLVVMCTHYVRVSVKAHPTYVCGQTTCLSHLVRHFEIHRILPFDLRPRAV